MNKKSQSSGSNPSTEKCDYCKKVSGSTKDPTTVFEDGIVVAFLYDHPLTRGHTVAVLKEHHNELASVNPDDAGHLGEIVAVLAKAIKDGLKPDKVNVAPLGDLSQHVHYHLIPKYASDEKSYVTFLSDGGELENPEQIVAVIRKANPLLVA
jgi:diadenosine tetraphosphate (Ap4A) HIT family hydrolase